MPAVNFTPAAAARIVNATRKVERTPTNLVGDRNPAAPPDATFWAYLSSPGGQTGAFWSWVRVRIVESPPNVSSGPVDVLDEPDLWEFAEPLTAGYLNAREANGNRRVPSGAVVLMSWAGYDGTGEPMYVFQYAGSDGQQQLPIHDHRDNFHGGFAFATYHPGTSLPQQPFFT